MECIDGSMPAMHRTVELIFCARCIYSIDLHLHEELYPRPRRCMFKHTYMSTYACLY